MKYESASSKAPIVSGRETTTSEDERKLGIERSGELSGKVNQFILRSTNALLSNHLPPKVKRVIAEEMKQSKILAYITTLKKLCNHPKLIYDTIKICSPGTSGFEDCIRVFPPEMFYGRSGSWTGGDGFWVELSRKMHVLARLLAHLRRKVFYNMDHIFTIIDCLMLSIGLMRTRAFHFL
ncbi:hypothetical protein IFM89_028870 [Coptis chinensis]|uniref:Uncharacterized protein n=1 Tax=Coptis chinensis TaxID=261450 RepID=A0A835H9S3_9MAGN|nr:hypothetical protein IFM89_028870 [Coptis chinensis]